MTNTPEQEALRAWASKHLGLRAAAAPQDIQKAFLQKIERENFMPPPATGYAYQVLAEMPEPSASDLGRQQARTEIEAGVRMEVLGLAKRFFELSTNVRQRIWKNLWRRAAWDVSARAHLTQLQPALFLVPDQLVGGEGPDAILAGMLCELFVMKPAERSVRRQELLDELQSNADYWDNASVNLSKRYPQLAELDPEFMTRLTGRYERAHQVRRAGQQRVAAKKKTAAAAGGGYSYGWVAVLAIVLLSRLATSFSSRPNNAPVPPAPNWQFDQEKLRDNLNRAKKNEPGDPIVVPFNFKKPNGGPLEPDKAPDNVNPPK